MQYDFSGWATRNDLQCSDGRIIRDGAFRDDDGSSVPLVWNHQHNSADNVLGHALLEYRPGEGMYAYCSFNDSDTARNVKEAVRHGDITSLSIYANKLKQRGGDVLHGAIREVSLVLAGANPGAFIDTILEHGDGRDEEAIIYTDEEIYLNHAEEENEDNMPEDGDSGETIQDVFDTLSEKQKKVVYALVGQAVEQTKSEFQHAEEMPEEDGEDGEDGGETIQDVFNTLSEKQKKVVYALVGLAIEKNQNGGESEEMKHNVFDQEMNDTEVLSHSEMTEILSDARRCGSLKDSVLAHGIDDIEWLFPEAKNLNATPEFIRREDSWVKKVMNGVHHTPFSRIKSVFADITEADARAKGYIKGNRKVEEVFGLLKRTTTPTTIYKKQKLDRDDVVDIIDFDVVAWLKTEMRMMLDEEIARAVLVGDGRNNASDDKINEQCIRPIWKDDDLFTLKKTVVVSSSATDDQKAKAFIRAVVKARKDYKGTGSPSLYTTEDMLTNCLLMEDSIGHVIYDSIEKLATALRVKEIITVPVMENQFRVSGNYTLELAGIVVNLADYNIGADKGGAINMFDDFDIDYNAQKYLIETRCSGALTIPYSAIAIEMSYAATLEVEPEDDIEVVLGKAVSDLQSGVMVHDDYITGTLKYVTGYTGYSGEVSEQSGNYLALRFEATDGATTTIELTGSPRGPVALDSDMQAVIRVTNKRTQRLIVTSTVNGLTVKKTYSLAGLQTLSA